MDEASLELSVYRYDVGGDLDYSETPNLERWSACTDDDEEVLYLANESVTRAEFFSQPDAVVHRFAEDAAKIIEVLLES